jgi:hypothetical protein
MEAALRSIQRQLALNEIVGEEQQEAAKRTPPQAPVPSAARFGTRCCVENVQSDAVRSADRANRLKSALAWKRRRFGAPRFGDQHAPRAISRQRKLCDQCTWEKSIVQQGLYVAAMAGIDGACLGSPIMHWKM